MTIRVGLGSHAQYVLDFGDGIVTSGVFSETVLRNHRLVFLHAYVTVGIYSVTVNVTNLVSKATAATTVGVLEEVTDVQVTIATIVIALK